MTSIYAAATPVAASAIAPIRPPVRAYSHHAAATRPPASTAPPATRNSGRRIPACAASTSSNRTPINVTATPATANTLPIQPSERTCRRFGGVGGGGMYAARGGWAYCGGYWAGGQYGTAGGTYDCGACGCPDSRRASSIKSADTLANCCVIAAKSADKRALTARGSL